MCDLVKDLLENTRHGLRIWIASACYAYRYIVNVYCECLAKYLLPGNGETNTPTDELTDMATRDLKESFRMKNEYNVDEYQPLFHAVTAVHAVTAFDPWLSNIFYLFPPSVHKIDQFYGFILSICF